MLKQRLDEPVHGSERLIDTVVIGGGQAGLATGCYLRKRGRDFVILDAAGQIGASWRRRWDSLRLFTPGGFSHLPGLAFPAPRSESPTKDAMADYLLAYAKYCRLPVQLGVQVETVRREGSDLMVSATDQRRWRARNVVVATSAHSRPFVPAIGATIDSRIVQCHSSDYHRPDQIRAGPVLVVGAGNSGAEIAIDLSRPDAEGIRRVVYLAGRDVGHIPPLGTWTYPLMQKLGRTGTALSQRGLKGGAEPLGRIRPGELKAAGIKRLPRVITTQNGLPVTEDGRKHQVTTVIWCTGFRPDHQFLKLPVLDAYGHLAHHRGVTDEPGLYIVGMPNQSSITSHLVGGVGRDADYVVNHLTHRPN